MVHGFAGMNVETHYLEHPYDRWLAGRVRSELERTTPTAYAIDIGLENGCVILSGPVRTDQRGRVVRHVSRVRGVHSVIDLMHEDATVESPGRAEKPRRWWSRFGLLALVVTAIGGLMAVRRVIASSRGGALSR